MWPSDSVAQDEAPSSSPVETASWHGGSVFFPRFTVSPISNAGLDTKTLNKIFYCIFILDVIVKTI